MNTFKNIFESLFECTFLDFCPNRIIQQFYAFNNGAIYCNSGNLAVEIFYCKGKCTVYKVSPCSYQLGVVF